MVFAVGEFVVYYCVLLILATLAYSGFKLWGVIALISVVFYGIIKHFNRYWQLRGVAGPELNLLFGSMLDLKRGCQAVDIENFKKFGSTYATISLGRLELITQNIQHLKQVFIRDFACFPSRFRTTFVNTRQPDSLMQNSMVNIEGDDWRRIRLICTPIFTLAKLKRFMPLFSDAVKSLAIKVDERFINESKPVPLKDVMSRLTLGIIAKVGFAINVDFFDDNLPFMHHSAEIMKFNISGLLSLFISSFPNFTSFVQRNFDYEFGKTEHHVYFKNLLEDLYEKRKADSSVHNDIMQLLMNALDEEFTASDENADIMLHDASTATEKARKQGLSKMELLSQCFVLLMAGYETTATTLQFAFYVLAKSPEIQARVRNEVESVLGDDEEITYEHLQQMTYISQVINETLRMYSPAPRTNRMCVKKTEIDGIEMTPGMLVTIPIFAIHYNPEHYPDPETFDPDRFSPEEKAKRDPLTFLPFGAGNRNCIGMKFAELEMKMALAFLIRHYRFDAPTDGPELPVPITTTGISTSIQPLYVIPTKIRNF